MDSDEDPEARIRELERAMADAARTSELGTAPMAGPPPGPPPPPPYGIPPLPQPGPRRSSRAGWLVLFALLVPTLVISGALILGREALHSAQRHTDRPAISGGGGPFDSTSTAPPTRARIGSPAPTSAASVTVPPPGGEISVSGINERRTVECDESRVSISGMDNTVTITGHCASVTVSGMDNVVALDAADTINASGMNNRVTYGAGSPRIDKSGFSNTVEQR